jgi:hypothetical protein
MKTLGLVLACTVLVTAASAQERSAGQANDAQVNYSALSNQISAVNTQNQILAATLTKIQTCNAKAMIFIGVGKTGADTDGCKSPATQLSGCYQRAGWYGAHVACDTNEVVTKVCSSGGDGDCVAPAGTIYMGGQTALDGWQGPKTPYTTTKNQSAYTVVTCCKMQ